MCGTELLRSQPSGKQVVCKGNAVTKVLVTSMGTAVRWCLLGNVVVSPNAPKVHLLQELGAQQMLSSIASSQGSPGLCGGPPHPALPCSSSSESLTLGL